MPAQLLCFLVFLLPIISNRLHAQETKPPDRLTIQKHPELKGQFICDIGHATFTAPSGWKPYRSGNNTYVILVPANERPEDPTKLISIDVGLPKTKTVRETAEAFAETWQGKLAQEPLKLDGADAVRVLATEDPDKLQPVDSVIVFHGGRAFLLLGGAKKKELPKEALDEIVRTWKWK